MPKIPGGYILISRKLLTNGLSKKPPLHRALWLWILQEANYKDTKNLKRGQLITTVDKMIDVMAFKSGCRIVRPSIKQVRIAIEYFKTEQMITTQKVSSGTLISVTNYAFYQDYKNYSRNTSKNNGSHNETLTKPFKISGGRMEGTTGGTCWTHEKPF